MSRTLDSDGQPTTHGTDDAEPRAWSVRDERDTDLGMVDELTLSPDPNSTDGLVLDAGAAYRVRRVSIADGAVRLRQENRSDA